MAQRSIKWCQSRLFLARRDASSANTPPTFPEHTAASRRPKPGRSTEPVPERPQVFINDNHTLEAELQRPFSQIILAPLSLQSCPHLLHRRLADIDVGVAFNVTRFDFLAHHAPPVCQSRLCLQLPAASELVAHDNAVVWPVAAPAWGESPREELPGGVGSSDAPPGKDASEAIVQAGSGVRGRASIKSRSDTRAVIARVGRSTISIP